MSPTYAVTGATGAVGGRVAEHLAAAGVSQRLVVRDPARAPALPGVEVAQASYAEPDALRRALTGTSTLFLVSASEAPDRRQQHLAAVQAAAGGARDRWQQELRVVQPSRDTGVARRVDLS